MKTVKLPVVCYITKKGQSYLSYYHYNKAMAEKEVELINKEKPLKLKNGDKVDWEEVDEFFVGEQEAF